MAVHHITKDKNLNLRIWKHLLKSLHAALYINRPFTKHIQHRKSPCSEGYKFHKQYDLVMTSMTHQMIEENWITSEKKILHGIGDHTCRSNRVSSETNLSFVNNYWWTYLIHQEARWCIAQPFWRANKVSGSMKVGILSTTRIQYNYVYLNKQSLWR